MDIDVIVQAHPSRTETGQFDLTRDSIEASDVVVYQTVVSDRRTHRYVHFLDILRRAAQSESDLVLRLEDDCVVNKHLLHNIRTWPALRDERFGLGWLYCPPAVPMKDEDLWFKGNHLAGAVAVLGRPDYFRRLVPMLEEELRTGDHFRQDVSLMKAVHRTRRRICLHCPPIVEHRIDIPSTKAAGDPSGGGYYGPGLGTTFGRFKPDWRRAATAPGA